MTAPVETQEPLFPRKAALQLQFLIVGASMGGLACAYNLVHAGHKVRILERSDGVAKAIGGMRSPPNLTRLLWRWGLGPKLEQVAVKATRLQFMQGESGEEFGSLNFHEEVMKELQSDILILKHADLHQMLYDLVIETGIPVSFNQHVVNVDLASESKSSSAQPSVMLENGERVYADVIIGADGGSSLVRELVFEDADEFGPAPFTSYTFTVPTSSLANDPDMSDVINEPAIKIWMGSNKYLLTHLVDCNRGVGVNVFYPDGEHDTTTAWEEKVSISHLDFSEFEPRVQRIMSLCTEAVKTRHVKQPVLDEWYDPEGKVTIIGEAVHLMNPGGAHNAAMAVEDAAVLGSLFSRLRERSQVVTLLSAYQDLRHARVKFAVQDEVSKCEFCSIPAGPQRDARNAALRDAMMKGQAVYDESPEEYLRTQWEQMKELFGYDAYEDADSWWVDWGVIHERAGKLEPLMAPGFNFSVVVDTMSTQNVSVSMPSETLSPVPQSPPLLPQAVVASD